MHSDVMAFGCNGGETVRESTVLLSVPCPREYQERFVHRPPNRRREYLAGEAEGGTIKEALYASFLEYQPYQKRNKTKERSADFPHSQECRDQAAVSVFMANLHPCLPKG